MVAVYHNGRQVFWGSYDNCIRWVKSKTHSNLQKARKYGYCIITVD